MNQDQVSDAIDKLISHAHGSHNADDPANLSDVLWMLDHGKSHADFQLIWNGIVDQLQHVNRIVNDDRKHGDHEFHRTLIYAVNACIGKCLDHAVAKSLDEVTRRSLLVLCWRICTGWDAVLSGDVEDVNEHVELEGMGDGIK